MRNQKSSRMIGYFYLLADLLILIVCLQHIPSIAQRAHFPMSIDSQGETVTVKEIISVHHAQHLSVGDTVLSVSGLQPRNIFELQFIADTKKKNDTISVAVSRRGEIFQTAVVLLPYYTTIRFILITFFVGIVMFMLSGLLIFSIPHEPLVHYLHNIIVSLSAALMLTWGTMDGSLWTAIATVLFFLSYFLFGLVFLLFCYALWKPSVPVPLWITLASYTAVVCYSGWTSYFYFSSVAQISLEQFRVFSIYLFIFRLFVVVAVCVGMGLLIATLGKKTSPEDATRVRWVIGGIVGGGLPYTIFGIIPVTFFGTDAFAEEISTLFFLLVPLCISVAFIRYNLLNLRSFVRRQRISTIFRLLLYSCVIFISAVLAAHVVEWEQFDTHFVIAFIAGTLVVLLLSVGTVFEQYVDEKLFQTKLNFRKTLKDSIAELQTSLDDRSLFHCLLEVIHHHLPIRAAAVYQYNNSVTRQLQYIGQQQGTADIKGDTIRLIENNVSPIVQFHTTATNNGVFDYAIAIRKQSGELAAIIGLYLEMRHDRLEDEDRDFLTSLAAEASLMLERFQLQEEIILKKNEARRSEEMNALKSFFVSSVSHDLRLPLTTIRMYTELLNDDHGLSKRKKSIFLRTILGETDRLTQSVENILNITAIERGKFQLTFYPVDIRLIVKRAVQAMQYEIKKRSATVMLSLPNHKLTVLADETALERAVMNLISNALKYSLQKSRVTVTVRKQSSTGAIIVSDHGIGIPRKEQAKIFEKFYRIERSPRLQQLSGLGIGLAVVKYIVNQHHGTISLSSKLNKGTTFTISLPLTVA